MKGRQRRLHRSLIRGSSEIKGVGGPESGSGSSSGKNAGMTSEQLNEDVRASIAASRPTPDVNVAREGGEVITHMLGDGRSVIDPTWTIWTAEAAEDLRARIGDNPIVGTGRGSGTSLTYNFGAPLGKPCSLQPNSSSCASTPAVGAPGNSPGPRRTGSLPSRRADGHPRADVDLAQSRSGDCRIRAGVLVQRRLVAARHMGRHLRTPLDRPVRGRTRGGSDGSVGTSASHADCGR
jgi:hypothetical protein